MMVQQVLLGTLSLLAFLIAGCSGGESGPGSGGAERAVLSSGARGAHETEDIQTELPRPMTFQRLGRWWGKVESARHAPVRALNSGRVVTIKVEDSAAVSTGEVLFLLGGPILEAQAAELRAKLEAARAAVDLSKKLLDGEAEALSKRLGTTRQREVAAAELKKSEIELEAAQRALESHRTALGVTAPISGRLSRRRVVVGQDVEAGEILAEAILERLRQLTMKFEGVVFLYRQPTKEKIDESFSGLPAVFGVTVYGDKLGALTAAAARVEEFLSSSEDFDNVINNTRVRRPEVAIRIDRTALGRYGLTVEQVFGALRAILQGDTLFSFQRQRETVSVVLHMDRGEVDAKDALRTILLRTPEGSPPDETTVATLGGKSASVRLERVASFDVQQVPASVSRLNGRREVTVVAEVEGNVFEVVGKVKKRLRALGLPEGISYEVTGQYPVLVDMALELLAAVIVAIFVIYAILYLEFRSALLPLAVLAAVPVSLAGAILLLGASGRGIDASVGSGFLTLVGISVNNAIILIDFRNREILSGRSGTDAITLAVAARLRPVLMTSLTTIAALAPTALHFGAGSRVFQPFAVTVIGGLLASTVATLFVLPALLAKRVSGTGLRGISVAQRSR